MEKEDIGQEEEKLLSQDDAKSSRFNPAVDSVCRQLRDNQCVHLDISRMHLVSEEMMCIGKAIWENESLRSIVLPTSCSARYPSPDVYHLLQKIVREKNQLQKVEFHATSEFTNFPVLRDLLVGLSTNRTSPKELIFSDVRGLVQDEHSEDCGTGEELIQALRNGAFDSVSCNCCSHYVTGLVLEGLTGSRTCEKLYISPVRGFFQNSLSLTRAFKSFPQPFTLAPFIARIFQSSTPLKTFHFYHVWKDDLDLAASSMAHHSTLQELALYGQHDGDPWMIAANLCTILRQTKVLERLSLSNLKFDPDSLYVLSQAMQQNESVTKFSMYRCGHNFKPLVDSVSLCRLDTKSFVFDMATMHPSHLNAILRSIQHSQCLQQLALHNLHRSSLKSLLVALAGNKSCESLDLSSRSFPTAVLKMLAAIIGKSPESAKLRHLKLQAWETSALKFSKALIAKKDCCLESLRLHDFQVGRDGLANLLDVVKNNTTLTCLHLRGAPLTEKAFECLCDELPELKHLKDLRFDWPVGPVNAEDFLTALDKNRTLLDIGGSLAPEAVRRAGVRIIVRNRIRSLADGDGVPGALWPHVFTCRGFANQPSLLCFVIKEVVGRGAWPTAPSRKRVNSHLPEREAKE